VQLELTGDITLSDHFPSPMKRSQRARRRTTRFPVRGWLLRCCLLLAAWQGPIPWWHCHGTLAASPTVESLSLARHLSLFHGTANSAAAGSVGWHWHFLPGPPGDGSPESSDQEPVRLPLRSSPDCISELMASFIAASMWMAAPAVPTGNGRVAIIAMPSQAVSHFFASFAPTLPMPLRLCIARC
jgi:hypothetical protein